MLPFLFDTENPAVKTLKLMPENHVLDENDIRKDQVVLQTLVNDQYRLIHEGYFKIDSSSVSKTHIHNLISQLSNVETHVTEDIDLINQALRCTNIVAPVKKTVETKTLTLLSPYERLLYAPALAIIGVAILGCHIKYNPETVSALLLAVAFMIAELLIKQLSKMTLSPLFPEPTREAKLEKWHEKEKIRTIAEGRELIRQEKINEWKDAAWIKTMASITTLNDVRYSDIACTLFNILLAYPIFTDIAILHPEVADTMKNIFAFVLCEHAKNLAQSGDRFTAIRKEKQKEIAGTIVDAQQWGREFLAAIGCATIENAKTYTINNTLKH